MDFDYKNLNHRISEILEEDVEIINDEFLLDNSNIDSLSMLTIISMLDQQFEINVTMQEIIDSKSIKGLKNLIKSKIK